MKPMLKYRGGKSKELKHYLHHLSDINYERYFEPFFGGGATYFAIEPQQAVINDINSRLINFYTDVRDNFNQLKSELYQIEKLYTKNQLLYQELKSITPEERVPNSNEELYYQLRSEFNYPSGKYLDSTLYFFINKTAYSGMIRYNKKGEYNVPFGRYKNFNTDLINQHHHELLQDSEIFNLDYSEIFNLATPNDIMFLDPPYDCVFNDYGNLEFENGFNEDEQRRLAQDFLNLNTRALMVIAKTPLTESLYSNFIVEEYDKNYSVNIRNRFKSEAKHIIIRNY
ncbi:Dam family site-specific DNA-(adenine-N6)-methyltransferase [Paraclostridium bifermentans]|uniref:DNA adenine methylase n=1 Tax=Paraclostridium bifermentans TaxID=1490 RepID=UPI00214A087A|nr:Dam family site-specific DNA-(adenine-N6)-methyltransferase [Paraclostridium bifermentans]MCR1877331.1 Dam family site-specific DNA-(adenine-N6)-methyltransferase [Paraclostridium bifermentans]